MPENYSGPERRSSVDVLDAALKVITSLDANNQSRLLALEAEAKDARVDRQKMFELLAAIQKDQAEAMVKLTYLYGTDSKDGKATKLESRVDTIEGRIDNVIGFGIFSSVASMGLLIWKVIVWIRGTH